MTQLYQGNWARHRLLARDGPGNGSTGNGNGGGNVPAAPIPSPPTTDSSTTPSPTSPSVAPTSSHSSDPITTPSTSSPPVRSTSSTAVLTTSIPSSSTPPTSVSTSSTPSTTPSATPSTTPSTTTPLSKTSSTTPSTSSTPLPTIASTPALNPIANTIQSESTPTSTFSDATLTGTNSIEATVSASSLTSASSDLSAGSIVGAVAGTLIGLAVLGFLVIFLLRRYRQSRRRALRDSDFGTFRRSMFATPRASAAIPTMPDMAETSRNVAPSLKEPYVPYSAATAAVQPPSQTLAAETAAAVATATVAGGIQERPKYVYGQDPTPVNQQRQQDDVATDVAQGGPYSSQPQPQSAYNAEVYGSYAKYEDVGNGIVGGVPAGTAMYQDAERAYQGQQGYDQNQYVTYDPSHYATYDQAQYEGYVQQQHATYDYAQQQQHAVYDYAQQHQQHYHSGSASDAANAYGGM